MKCKVKLFPFLNMLAIVTVIFSIILMAPLTQASGIAAALSAGSAGGGRNAFENIGRIDQNGGSFTGYGYLSYISGLDQTLLFIDPAVHSPETAHFTFYSTASLTARDILGTIFTINSLGTVSIYYQTTPTGTFADPNSFKAGTLIATYNIRGQDILSVQAPNLGIAIGFSEMEQTAAVPFNIGNAQQQFGQVGLLLRSFYTGEATRTDPVTPVSFILYSGNATVTGPGSFSFLPLVRKAQ